MDTPTAYLLFLIIFLVTTVDAQRGNPKPHHEDLTVHRLQFPDVKDTVLRKREEKIVEIIPAANSVTEKVNEVLDSIARFNKTKMFMDGFTIQVYSGLKREDLYVKYIATDVLHHRMVRTIRAEVENVGTDEVVSEVLRRTPIP